MSGATSRPITRTSYLESSSSIDVQLRIGTAGGETLAFDLPMDIASWKLLEVDPVFQARIRGVNIAYQGHVYALCLPKAFRRVTYSVELQPGPEDGQVGNVPPATIRATAAADDVLATLTLYLNSKPPMVRFDLRRTGKMRWQAP